MSDNFLGKATPHQVYVGQTSHALTRDELRQLMRKIDVQSFPFSWNESQIKGALKEIAKTATGAQQLREIINHPRDKFTVTSGLLYGTDKLLESRGFLGKCDFSEERGISIHSDMLEYPHLAGEILLHELMHARQTAHDMEINNVLADAETQALSTQLAIERPADQERSKYEKENINYRKSYEYNYAKWHKQLVAKGYSAEACKAYAHDITSKETRAQYIKDFVGNPDSTQTALKYPCKSPRNFYKKDTIHQALKSAPPKKPYISEKMIDEMVQKYEPFLKSSDFNFIRKENREMVREIEKEYTKRSLSAIDDYLKNGNKTGGLAKALPQLRQKIKRGKELNPKETLIQKFLYDKQFHKNPRGKEILLQISLINYFWAKGGPKSPDDPILKDMLDEYSLLRTGEKGRIHFNDKFELEETSPQKQQTTHTLAQNAGSRLTQTPEQNAPAPINRAAGKGID